MHRFNRSKVRSIYFSIKNTRQRSKCSCVSLQCFPSKQSHLGLRPSPRLTSSRIIVSNRLHLHYAGRPSLQNPQRPDVPVRGARWRREQTLTPVAHRIRVPVRTKDGRYLEIEAQHCPSECVRVAGSHAPISF